MIRYVASVLQCNRQLFTARKATTNSTCTKVQVLFFVGTLSSSLWAYFRLRVEEYPVSNKRRKSVAIVLYEGGTFVAKFRLLPADVGTEIEQTSLTAFVPNVAAFNLLMVVHELVNDMWKDDVKRLMENVSNDAADDEWQPSSSPDDEPPF